MSFKKELVKNILFKAANVGLSFIVTVLIVRLLGAEGNGVYSLFVANSAIIVLVGGFSFNSGLTYYAAAGKFSNAALLNTLVLVAILQFALIFLCEKIFFGLSGISLFGDIGWSAISLWGAGYVFALLINSYTAAIFSGNKWFDAVNVLAVVANIVFIIVFALMLFPGKGYTFANTIGTVKT